MAISRSAHVLVVGGGIAGIACAVRLSEAGVRVTLLETRKKLGGRATSFDDVRSGETLDNCQHVVLGCCTNYLDLLERLGVADQIRWTREQYWIEEGGRTSVVKPATLPPMPAPLHFSWSFLRAKFLTLSEASAIGRCCIAMLRVDRRRETDRTFAAFLRQHGQSDRAIRRFWEPVIVSACNLSCDRVAASSAIHVFQEGFLANARAADVGVSKVPLVRLYERVAPLLARTGGAVELGAGIANVNARSARATDGRAWHADAVVCATPVERVVRLIDDETRRTDPRFAGLDRFTHSPILGVHLRFDRGVMGDLPHCVLVERGVQWLFRKSDDGSSVHAVISAADAWLDLSEGEIGDRVTRDLHACLPASRSAQLISARAVKEKLATFAPTPGLDALRPNATGPSGIVLAGDYTATGWPATMEGAARSGYAAAASLLNHSTPDRTSDSRGVGVLPGLAVSPLARALGLRTLG